MQQLRRDIAEAEARMRVTFGTRSAIRNLHESLDAGELVLVMVACFYSGSDGLLVLTDRRVIAVRDDFSKFRLQAVPLGDVRALDYAPAVHDGLAVLTDAGRVAVRKMDRRDSDAFAAALVERVPTIIVGASRPHSGEPFRAQPPRAPAAPVPPEAPVAGVAGDADRQAAAATAAQDAVLGAAAQPPAPTAGQTGPDGDTDTHARTDTHTDTDAGAGAPAVGGPVHGGTSADKDVLLGVLADLHAKGLLTADELATKIAQVTSSP